jgi:tRNA pseudouridine55 synthase
VGPFDIAQAVSLEELDSAPDEGRRQFLLPVDAGLGHLPAVPLDPGALARIRNGREIALGAASVTAGCVRVYEAGSRRFLGIGDVREGRLRPLRLIVDARAAVAEHPAK